VTSDELAVPVDGSPVLRGWYAVLIPVVVFLIHSLMFLGWIIDDAGISFAYARNLAHGHGLVSQPGNAPVEGFSNLSWIVILSLFFVLDTFHPIVVPKVLASILVTGSYIVFYLAWRGVRGVGAVSVLVALTLTSLNTAFVAWTSSGLENALYLLLICLLMYLIIESRLAVTHRSQAIIMGALVTAIALARPDGLIYLVVLPLSQLIAPVFRKERVRNADFFTIGMCCLAFALTFGMFLLFRVYYFGDIFPNVYYAKDGPGFAKLIWVITLKPGAVTKLIELMGSVVGSYGAGALLGLTVLSTLGFVSGLLRWQHAVLLLFLISAILVYLLLPNDWMPEFRFATPFILFFYSYGVFVLGELFSKLIVQPGHRKPLVALVVLVCLSGVVLDSIHRSANFASEKVMDFNWVSERYGRKFNRYADQVPLEDASALLPDIGGTLHCTRLRIFDLAGLCDKTIARTLRQSKPAFHDYVFDRMRPTFIHTHGYWTLVAQLHADPRFRRDYVPIQEHADEWIRNRTGQEMFAGDYVRKEVVRKDPGVLDRLRAVE
jgi:hypothetical protein